MIRHHFCIRTSPKYWQRKFFLAPLKKVIRRLIQATFTLKNGICRKTTGNLKSFYNRFQDCILKNPILSQLVQLFIKINNASLLQL